MGLRFVALFQLRILISVTCVYVCVRFPYHAAHISAELLFTLSSRRVPSPVGIIFLLLSVAIKNRCTNLISHRCLPTWFSIVFVLYICNIYRVLQAPGPASAMTLIAANERNPRLALMSPLLAKGFIEERAISTDFLIPMNYFCAKYSAVVVWLVGVAGKNCKINNTS